jgi:hypothetical protein
MASNEVWERGVGPDDTASSMLLHTLGVLAGGKTPPWPETHCWPGQQWGDVKHSEEVNDTQ